MRNLDIANDTSFETTEKKNNNSYDKDEDANNVLIAARHLKILLFIKSKDMQQAFLENLPSQYVYTFVSSDSYETCLRILSDESYDILVTDFCGLSKTSHEAITKFKDTSERLAIIALTLQPTQDQEIACLNSGVDYVISAPFNADYIMACIKVVMRWRNLNRFFSSNIGPFKFENEKKVLVSADLDEIRLTDKEVRILQYLAKYKGQVISRSDLLENVWGYNVAANTHTVQTHIYRLRKKIGAFADSKSIIISEVGGYRLVT